MKIEEYIQKEAEKYVGFNYSSYNYRSGYADGLSAGIELAKELVMYLTGYGEEKAKLFIENHINQKEGK